MPICIHCTTPVPTLYTTYSKADDRSLGKGVRLTQCPSCKRFADKYVEHDFVVVFIDLVLVKSEVYRHLLFNQFGGSSSSSSASASASSGVRTENQDAWDRSIIRLATILLLFDVYLTWTRTERATPLSTSSTSPYLSRPNSNNADDSALIITQYLFFLALCTLETLAFHIPIRLLLSPPPSLLPAKLQERVKAWTYPYPNRVSTALLVSAATPKMFPILMLIWPWPSTAAETAVSTETWGFTAARVVEWAVLGNNIAALQILLGCGWARAGVLVGVGAVARDAVSARVLGSVGLWRDGMGVVGGLGEVVRGLVRAVYV